MLVPLERQRPPLERLFHRKPIKPLPAEVEPYKDTIEVTNWGKMTIASAPFAQVFDVEQLLKHVDPAIHDEARTIIEKTGVTHRYHIPSETSPTVEQFSERAASIGGLLIRKIMEEKKWKNVDHIYFTSAFLPEDVAETALIRAGLDPQKVGYNNYRLACAGAVAAFVDSLADPKMKNKKVMVVSLEPLSSQLRDKHFTLEGIAIPAIFGDDFAAIGYNPSDYELLAAQSLVKYDKGTIKLHKFYKIPTHDENELLSHWVIPEDQKAYISISDRGVFFNTDEPEDRDTAEMLGKETGIFFGEESPLVIKAIIDKLPPGIKVENVIAHQPSGPVVRFINKVLKRLKVDIPPLQFVMPDMKRSNSSSATTLVTWQYLAKEAATNPEKQGTMDPKKPTFIFAPGIGSVLAGGVFRELEDIPLRQTVWSRLLGTEAENVFLTA